MRTIITVACLAFTLGAVTIAQLADPLQTPTTPAVIDQARELEQVRTLLNDLTIPTLTAHCSIDLTGDGRNDLVTLFTGTHAAVLSAHVRLQADGQHWRHSSQSAHAIG